MSHSMAASSSKISETPTRGNLRRRDEVQPVLQANKRLKPLPSEIPKLADQPVTPHDIFLSHSGAQKGFVKDLYDELSHRGFNTFFDLAHHSLPLAENFPMHIFSAANNCKLAVVVLSEEFVSTKWPMIELSAFVEAGVQILPLFFKLLPEHLKDGSNLKRWGEAWEGFSAQDPVRIKITEWENAIEALRSKNGLAFKGQALEGETTYLHRVVSGICEKVPMAIKFDGSHIHGMNQLRQVILDEFKKMESPGKVNVLGLYGLPGSGKSTLCQCLHDHFYPIYGGRSLYLELPTKPSTQNLVQIFKKLLHLTDFNDRFNTSNISTLGQLSNVLARYQLPRCRVFLVIDNISSDESIREGLQLCLRLGLGPGSKVILVARTLVILRPISISLKQYEQHSYTWSAVQIPSIQETEAIQILLQTSGVGTMDAEHAVQRINLSPTQRETIVRIVRMCNFGSVYNPQYLPLVMKTMGAMLIQHDGDFLGWGSDLQNFWDGVKNYKETAVIKLVEESFKALPDENLQILFFDLSLFIVQLGLNSLQETYVLLSSIYDGRSVADIRLMVKDLESYCFLTLGWQITVHDMYLEFAKSFSRSNSSIIRYHWRNDRYTRLADDVRGPDVLSLKEVEAKNDRQVRTMILEVQGDGYERVELQGFSSLKALLVRNCKSLEVLVLVGLRSLASLDILSCPNFRHVDGTSDLCNVKRLSISFRSEAEDHKLEAITSVHLIRPGWPGEGLLARIFKWWQSGEALLPRIFKWWKTPRPRQPCSLEMAIATKMRGLQQLSLENTGIRRLTDMSSCWPQLENLSVIEYHLEALEVGNLPNLKSFKFYTDYYNYFNTNRIPRFVLQGKGLLERCPQLENVQIDSAFFEEGELGTLPPNIKCIRLRSFYPARIFPNFSPSAHCMALEEVWLSACNKLEKISFPDETFRKLTKLEVQYCHSLVEVTGLNFLFSLRDLRVLSCENLRAIIGPFDNLKVLKTIEILGCSKFTGLAGADLENLVSIEVLHFPLKRGDRHQRLNLKNLQNLRHLNVTSWPIADDESGCSATSTDTQQLGPGMLEGFEDLVDLEHVSLDGRHILHEPSLNNHKHERTKPALSLSFSSLVGMNQHRHAQTLAGIQPSTCHLISSGKFAKLTDLTLEYLENLRSLQGIESLVHLEDLYVSYCPMLEELPSLHTLVRVNIENCSNLRSLQGIESLVHLEGLYVSYCPMLEELPSLHTLVSLVTVRIQHCSNLKYVQGADERLKAGTLRAASFEGCRSLVHLPISVNTLRQFEERNSDDWFDLNFNDCKFTGTKAMMEWAVNEDMPSSIRVACYYDLHEKYCTGDSSLREVLFDGLFPFLLNCFEPDDNECVNFRNRKLQEKVGGVAKKDLVQEFQAHPQCKLLIFRLLDKFGFYYFYAEESDLPLEGIHAMFDAIVEYIFDKEEGSESQEEEGYDDSEDESEEEGYDTESGAE